MSKDPELFSCVMATGIAYCDKSREKNGDYVKVAHLFFDDLTLAIFKPRSKLLPEIKADAAKIQSRKGEQFQVSASGQTITLGHALLKHPGFIQHNSEYVAKLIKR